MLEAIETDVAEVDEPVDAAYKDEARPRSVRDADDGSPVACTLALDAGIWTMSETIWMPES